IEPTYVQLWPVMMVFLTALTLVQSGSDRMLALTSAQRAQPLPDVPTIVEAGFPNLIVEAWTGVMAPAKTPAAAIGKFNAEVNKLLALEDVKAAAARIDVTLAGGAPETPEALAKKGIRQLTRVGGEANIKAKRRYAWVARRASAFRACGERPASQTPQRTRNMPAR